MHKLLSRFNYYRIGSNFDEESAGFAQPVDARRRGGLHRAFVERINPLRSAEAREMEKEICRVCVAFANSRARCIRLRRSCA